MGNEASDASEVNVNGGREGSRRRVLGDVSRLPPPILAGMGSLPRHDDGLDLGSPSHLRMGGSDTPNRTDTPRDVRFDGVTGTATAIEGVKIRGA